ncbi:MAG: type VI secretion system-associated FHA domain protein TagH [Gammaproteobacteria bacterium]|jgi:type VI secretion system protein
MPLTLRIISSQKDVLGPEGIHVFSVHGGSIGRSPDNDWVLPDPERFLSAHHASIDYQGGAYFLSDKSTNGVFVNDADQPVGHGTPIRLYDGDRLRMGEYDIQVSILNVSLEGKKDSAVFVADDQDENDLPGEKRPSDLGRELLDAAADPRPDHSEDFSVIDNVQSMTGTRVIGEKDVEEDEDDITQEVAQLQGESLSEAARLVFEAAGMDPRKIPEGREKQFLLTAGRMLRLCIGGLLDVLRARSRIKGELDLEQTGVKPGENNPLKFAPDVDEALDALLFYRGAKYLPPMEALEEAYVDLRAHERALVAAMKAAFDEQLAGFDPDKLEALFNRGLRRGALKGMSNPAKFWDLYREHYDLTEKRAERSFDEVTARVFAEAYSAEIRRLAKLRAAGRDPD